MSDGQQTEPSDQSLLRRFQVGEQDAATRLYMRYARRLHGLAVKQTGSELRTRLDPEDIVQSVFRTFFRRAKEGFYEVPDGEELWKLFLVIGLHKIRDAATFHRASRRSVSRTQAMPEISEELTDRRTQDAFAEEALRIVISDLLEQLSESQRQIVMLRLDGSQVQDISTLTRRSKRTVERTLQKFRDMLRQQLGESVSGSDAVDEGTADGSSAADEEGEQ
ncbi:MAG: sigma-70 family RNA polymerase sigma factor [Planctomyces sp.]|nr:sigma-70 family RNA polymerase sigma factor [Planctomyces sp.]